MDSIAVVAMDIHKKFSKAMLMDAGARVVAEHDIKHGAYRIRPSCWGNVSA